MDNSSSLALATRRELTPNIWQMLSDMAPVMYQSRLFGVSSPAQAATIMLKGYELGLSVTASFEFVQVVQGKPSLSPRGALALLHNAPDITELTIERLADKNTFIGYACTMARKNGFRYTARFTLEDAKRAGVLKPGSGWENYPENMCLWRAVGFAADVVAPDITAGMTAMMKMPEQFGVALSHDGEIIEAQAVTPVTTPVAAPTRHSTADEITLESLLERWTAEQILVANEGKIPATADECAAVLAKLEAV